MLELMRALAMFEGYEDHFNVTEQAINTLCLEQQRFNVLVAEVQAEVQGILVYFFQPFTYDLTPWLVIKELYVADALRQRRLGDRLYDEARRRCRQAGGRKMKWEVLAANTPAQAFYLKKGASLDEEWRLMSAHVC